MGEPPVDLAARLEAAIVTLRENDPFLSIHVLVSTPLLGTWLRQKIFGKTGHFAVYFVRPEQLAWQIVEGKALLEGVRPVPEFAELAMVLAAARQEGKRDDLHAYLKAALHTRGFAPALLRTLHDLDAAAIYADALNDLAPSSAAPERLHLLARVQSAVNGRLDAARLLSRASLLRRASEVPRRDNLGAIVVCPFDHPSSALEEFLTSLSRGYPLIRLEPASAYAAETTLQRLQSGLFQEAPPASTDGKEAQAIDATVRFLAASGEHLEAIEIARIIADVTTNSDVTYGEIGVLLRAGAERAALDAAFERAGIDAYFLEGTPRVDAAARALSLLLELLERDFERGRVMEFLTTAQVPWEVILGEDAEFSAARWDRLSAKAGIVSGIEQWRSGLARATTEAKETAELFERDPEDDRDARLMENLRKVVDRLAADFSGFPDEAGWGAYLDATLLLLERWVRRGDAVRIRLERALRPLAAHAPGPTRREFVAHVQELLATQTYREGELGAARVFVGGVAAASGLSFRLVFVPGLAERRFPATVRPDPLLLDDERRTLSGSLFTTQDGQERERRLFATAVNAATERLVLSYPRVDSNGRETVPSSFLLRAAEAASGRRLTTGGLLALAEPGETVLGRAWPKGPELAVDVLERDLSLVSAGGYGQARHLLTDAPHFVRARAAEAAGWKTTLTAWDGVLDLADADLAEWVGGLRLGKNASATTLQDFAACPYRHFLKRGLRLRAWEEPSRVYQPDPKERGSFFHEALERTFSELLEKGALPLRLERLAEAQALAHHEIAVVLDAAALEGRIVNRRLLEPLEIEMCRDIDELLRRETEDNSGFVPAAFESEFEEISFAFGDEREVTLRGKLDRIDLATNPVRLRVIDYKTGGFYDAPGEQFKGGRELQLAVYNLVAERLYTDHLVTEAIYRYGTEKGGFHDKGCANSEQNRETLRGILRHLDGLATAGVFARSADSCQFCDYQSICGAAPFRDATARRKELDPRLEGLRLLRAIE
jgi:ATP-dependent helicase/nuclease subunit B